MQQYPQGIVWIHKVHKCSHEWEEPPQKLSTQCPHTYSELDFSKNYTEINDYDVR